MKKTTIDKAVEARNVKIAEDQAWEMLQGGEEIIVGRGKDVLVLHPATDSREKVLPHCLGRSGSLRAPTLKIGKRFIVGFNEEMYKTYVK